MKAKNNRVHFLKTYQDLKIGPGQECHGSRNFLRPAEAAERRPGFLVLRAFPGLRVQFGVDWTRLNGVDQDALGAQVLSPAPAEAGHGELGSVVDAHVRAGGALAHHAADVDDSASGPSYS